MAFSARWPAPGPARGAVLLERHGGLADTALVASELRIRASYVLRRTFFGVRYAEAVTAHVEQRSATRALRKRIKAAAQDDPQAVVALARDLLQSEDQLDRAYAARKLARLDAELAVPILRDALDDEDSLVVSTAAYALGYLRDRSALPDLLDVLASEYSMEREAAACALGGVPHRSAVPALAAALNDPEPSVQRSAARSLANIETPEAARALTDARPRAWRTRLAVRRAERRLRRSNTALFE